MNLQSSFVTQNSILASVLSVSMRMRLSSAEPGCAAAAVLSAARRIGAKVFRKAIGWNACSDFLVVWSCSEVCRESEGLSRLSWVGPIARGMGHGGLGIARHVVDGCGSAINRSGLLGLKLQLEFQQLQFMLLLDQGKFGCRRASGLLSFLLLVVKNQTGDEISSKADQLRISVMTTVFRGFLLDDIEGLAAVAATACDAREGDKAFITSAFIAEDVCDEGLGVSVGSGEGEKGSAGSDGGSGEAE